MLLYEIEAPICLDRLIRNNKIQRFARVLNFESVGKRSLASKPWNSLAMSDYARM